MEQESTKPLSHYHFHAGGIVSSGLLLMPPILGIIKGFLPEALKSGREIGKEILYRPLTCYL